VNNDAKIMDEFKLKRKELIVKTKEDAKRLFKKNEILNTSK